MTPVEAGSDGARAGSAGGCRSRGRPHGLARRPRRRQWLAAGARVRPGRHRHRQARPVAAAWRRRGRDAAQPTPAQSNQHGRHQHGRTTSTGGTGDLATALHWLADTIETELLLTEITDSVARISALVGAAKQYSQLDRAPYQVVDIHELLDSTLAMLAARSAMASPSSATTTVTCRGFRRSRAS